MEFLIFGSFISSIIAAAVAKEKGRSAMQWFVLGFFLPWISLIIILCLSKTQEKKESDAIKAGEIFRCPVCNELIRAKALKCRFCGETFGEDLDNKL